MPVLTTTNSEILGVGLGEGRSRGRSRGRIGRLGIVRGGLTSLAPRSGRVSRPCRVVVIVYGPTTRLAGHVTTGVRSGLLSRRGGSIEVPLLGKMRLAGLFHDLVTVFVRESVVRFFAGQGLGLLEGRKAAFCAILLLGLAVRLGFDGI